MVTIPPPPGKAHTGAAWTEAKEEGGVAGGWAQMLLLVGQASVSAGEG